MKNTSSKKPLLILFHILFWALPVVAIELSETSVVLGVFRTTDFGFFYPLYYGLAVNMFFFYFSIYYLAPLLLNKYNIQTAIIGLFVFYILISLFETAADSTTIRLEGMSMDNRGFNNTFFSNLLLNFLLLTVIYGYFFIESYINNEKNRLVLREEKLKMELDFLKSQVNPHFLFNTLNNLFASAKRSKDNQTADGISKLSGLMRYSLYEANVDKVPLQKEINYLLNYIELQKLRFSEDDDIHIDLKTKGGGETVRLAPMVLIPFVENAFKHGISLREPSFIVIEIEVVKKELRFVVRNSIHQTAQNTRNSGIGLKNARRRLDLLYCDQYNLNIRQTGGIFEVELTINGQK